MLVRRPFLTVFFGLWKERFQCYRAHFKFNQILLVLKLLPTTIFIIVKTLVQIPFVEASLWRIQMLVRRPFLTVFFGLWKERFQCYLAHFKFNQIVLVLKLLPTTIFIIVKTLVQIPFVEASLWRIQMLVRKPFLTVLFGLWKVRFQCYRAHFMLNKIVLVLKLLATIIFIIVKTFLFIPFVEDSLWRIQMLVRRPFLTVFFALWKVRLQCYRAHFKFNQIVLVLKLLLTSIFIIVKTLV